MLLTPSPAVAGIIVEMEEHPDEKLRYEMEGQTDEKLRNEMEGQTDEKPRNQDRMDHEREPAEDEWRSWHRGQVRNTLHLISAAAQWILLLACLIYLGIDSLQPSTVRPYFQPCLLVHRAIYLLCLFLHLF